MNKLKLKIKAPLKNLCVEIDGQVFEPEKDESLNNCYAIETEKSTVSVVITRFLELETKLWWLWQILYFVVSLFGILDLKQEKKQLKVFYKAEIALNGENVVELSLNRRAEKAVNVVSTNAEINEIENKLEKSQIAIKRKKILKISKIMAWIAILAIVILIIFLR